MFLRSGVWVSAALSFLFSSGAFAAKRDCEIRLEPRLSMEFLAVESSNYGPYNLVKAFDVNLMTLEEIDYSEVPERFRNRDRFHPLDIYSEFRTDWDRTFTARGIEEKSRAEFTFCIPDITRASDLPAELGTSTQTDQRRAREFIKKWRVFARPELLDWVALVESAAPSS